MSRLPRPSGNYAPLSTSTPPPPTNAPLLSLANSQSSDVPLPRVSPNNPFASPQRSAGSGPPAPHGRDRTPSGPGPYGTRIPSPSPLRTPVSASRVHPPVSVPHAASASPSAASVPSRLAPLTGRDAITPPGRRPVPYAADELPRAPSSAGTCTGTTTPVHPRLGASGPGSVPALGYARDRGATTPLRLPSPSHLGGASAHSRLPPPSVPALTRNRTVARQPSTPALRVPHRGVPSSAPAQAYGGTGHGLRRTASVVLRPSPTPTGEEATQAHAYGYDEGAGSRHRVVTEPVGGLFSPAGANRTRGEERYEGQRSTIDGPSGPMGRAESEGPIVLADALALTPQTSARSSDSLPARQSTAPAPNPRALAQPALSAAPSSAVPPHVRDRLRLLHHLGSILGISASEVSGRIDIPGLLARVDQVYEKRNVSLGPSDSASSEGREKDGSGTFGGGVKKGVWGRSKRLGKKPSVERQLAGATAPREPGHEGKYGGPVFGVMLHELPASSLCTSLIGGQRHDLPVLIFTVVEEIYKRGMSQAGIFRLSGDPGRIGQLTKAFDLPPTYGDGLDLEWEPMHNLTGLVKRWVRDLPEPVLDEGLLAAFMEFCVGADGTRPTLGSDDTHVSNKVSTVQMKAAQILLKLLPPLHFSLCIYLLAFLGQLPLFPDNKLSIESISTIFGPALCAPRSAGVPGIGPSVQANPQPEATNDRDGKRAGHDSQRVLAWLLIHWSTISERVLDTVDELCGASPPGAADKGLTGEVEFNPALLSPVDIRTRLSSVQQVLDVHGTPDGPTTDQGAVRAHSEQSWRSDLSDYSDRRGSPAPFASPQSDLGTSMSPARHKRSQTSGSLFARALGSWSSATGGRKSGELPRRNSTTSLRSDLSEKSSKWKEPKRSSSFASLSNITVKDVLLPRHRKSRGSFDSTRSTSPSGARDPFSGGADVTNILGSLHELLVSKDKQIARDARELAGLRQSLADAEEKSKKLSAYSSTVNGDHSHGTLTPRSGDCPCGGAASTPQITITASASSPSDLAVTPTDQDRLLYEVQAQLSTAMAALEASRQTNELQAARVKELEKLQMRVEMDKENERRQMQTELGLERAKLVGLTEERDVAKQRLERIKTTLFSVQ